MNQVVVGQRVIGKCQTSRGKGAKTELLFLKGTVTRVEGEKFWVKYDAIKGDTNYPYKQSDIDRTVFLKEVPIERYEEQMDYELEKERLGVED